MGRSRGRTDGIAALADRYELSADAAAKLGALLEALVDDPFAPTAVRDQARALDDHLADSLVALELQEVQTAARIVDIGSGAGVPGLVLAIALPEIEFLLLESAARKCAFIERTVARCEISNARAVHARAESFAEGAEAFDVVTARAVAPLDVVAEYAAPLLRIGGTLVAWRGRRDAEAEAAAMRAAAQLGLQITEIRAVQPYPAAEHRHLHLMSKVTSTPLGFPRRPGMAAKHPLGLRPARSRPSDRRRR